MTNSQIVKLQNKFEKRLKAEVKASVDVTYEAEQTMENAFSLFTEYLDHKTL